MQFLYRLEEVITDAYSIDRLTDYIIQFSMDNGISPDTFYGVPEGSTLVGAFTQAKWAKMRPDYGPESGYVIAMGRKIPKTHGDMAQYVAIPKGKTAIIEDTATTGASILNEIEKLHTSGHFTGDIVAVICLTDRNEKNDDGKMIKEVIESTFSVPYFKMSNGNRIIKIAYDRLMPGEDIGRAIVDYYKRYGADDIKIFTE